MKHLILPALCTALTLSACVSPNDPTVSRGDVARAFDEARDISRLPFTLSDDLPTGSVIYRGQLGADVSGDANGSILGDMRMEVHFARNDVDGTIDNINLIDPNGTPDQRFSGDLDITGAENSGRLDAFASGTLTGVDNDNQEVDTQMLLTLDGDVFSDTRQGDAVFGSATGTGRGDFDIDVDGVFFGRAD